MSIKSKVIKEQHCTACDDLTGRCEDDSLYFYDEGPLCEVCLDNYEKLEALLFHQQRKQYEIKHAPEYAKHKMQRNINKRERRIQRLRDAIEARKRD